jgi:hypothetical protein
MIAKSPMRQQNEFSLMLITLILLVVTTTTHAQLTETRIPTSTPGVTVIEIEDPAGPWSLRVVEWNRNIASELRLIPAKGAIESTERVAALETTSSMAARINPTMPVVAAINADFFNRRGEPVNRMMSAGEWILSLPDNSRRSVLTIDSDQQLWMGPLTLSTNLCFKSQGVYPPCVPLQWNREPALGSASMLNHWFSDTLKSSAPHIFSVRSLVETDLMHATHGTTEFELSVERSEDLRVGSLIPDWPASPKLPLGTSWLAMQGDYWESFSIRDTLSIETIYNGPLTLPEQIIGGGPLLVQDARMVVDSMAVVEGVAESFLTTRHPRSAIGWNADQSLVWLVVVDGRQEHSIGMSLQELSQFFLKLGATEALNLDGGGSSAILADGKVLNSPSDPTGERRVTNALLLVR